MDRSASWESKDAMFIMIVRGEVDRSASWESKDAMFIMIVRGRWTGLQAGNQKTPCL